jgi:hypothetical protein
MAQDSEEFRDDTAALRAMRQIEDGLVRIARERAKVRPEDWATLFRQMQALLQQLVTHSFVVGDMQAELLVERILRSETLEEVDARTDDLAEYVLRKAQYVAALKAAKDGVSVDAPQHVALRNTSSEVTRAEAAAGPSGDDFGIGGTATPDRPRRSLLRL